MEMEEAKVRLGFSKTEETNPECSSFMAPKKVWSSRKKSNSGSSSVTTPGWFLVRLYPIDMKRLGQRVAISSPSRLKLCSSIAMWQNLRFLRDQFYSSHCNLNHQQDRDVIYNFVLNPGSNSVTEQKEPGFGVRPGLRSLLCHLKHLGKRPLSIMLCSPVKQQYIDQLIILSGALNENIHA